MRLPFNRQSDARTDHNVLLTREYESALKSGGTWYGLTGRGIRGGVPGNQANVIEALAELVNAGKLKSKTEGNHHNAPTYYWLPGKNRADSKPVKPGTSREQAGNKGNKPEDEDWQSPTPMANPAAPNVPAGWLEVW